MIDFVWLFHQNESVNHFQGNPTWCNPVSYWAIFKIMFFHMKCITQLLFSCLFLFCHVHSRANWRMISKHQSNRHQWQTFMYSSVHKTFPRVYKLDFWNRFTSCGTDVFSYLINIKYTHCTCLIIRNFMITQYMIEWLRFDRS